MNYKIRHTTQASFLLATACLLTACGGGGGDSPSAPVAAPAPTAVSSGSATSVVTQAAPDTTASTDWCNQTVNFNANTLPSNWKLTKVRTGPGIVNNRLEAQPTDSGSRIDAEPLQMHPQVNSISVEYTALHADSLYGILSGIEFVRSNGQRWTFMAANASYNSGANNLAFNIDQGTGRFGDANATGGRVLTTVVPITFGEHKFRLEVTNTSAKWTATNLASGRVSTATQTIPAGLSLADVVSTDFFLYTTTGSTTWADDLSIKCLLANGNIANSTGQPNGNGGGGGNTEVINGIVVPRAPNVTANNATVQGIDANQNGVRDDVERSLAVSGVTTDLFAKTLIVAARVQDIVVSPSSDRSAALQREANLICAVMQNNISSKIDHEILTNTVNTPDRKTAYRRHVKLAGAYFGSELPTCK